MNYTLTITHLYPSNLNLYGDIGNIIALKQRCNWRDIDTKIYQIGVKDKIPSDTDLFFIGGGQDEDELSINKDLINNKQSDIKKHVHSHKVFLLVCAGLQMFGKYFIGGKGEKIKGLGILDLKTVSPNDTIKDRCIGNRVIKLNPDIFPKDQFSTNTLVGFENHIGQTVLGKNVKPLGTVIYGKGNNNIDNTEGAVYKNIFATYSHGPVLPKNPHFADFLIKKSLEIKYKNNFHLKKLDDSIEVNAHNMILKRYSKTIG